MNAFLSSNGYATYARDRLGEYEPAPLKASCAEIKLTGRVITAVIVQPTFAGTVPETGQWIDQLVVDRCGTRAQRNLLVIARGKGQLQAVPLIPGSSVTSPVLQRDAMLPASVSANARLKCEKGWAPIVIDSKVTDAPTPGRPWREEWTFAGCGEQTVVLPIDFTPDGKGGTSFTVRGQ